MLTKNRTRLMRLVIAALTLALVAASCGDDDNGSAADGSSSSTSTSEAASGAPTRGGTLTVGLQADSCGYVPGGCTISFSGSSVELALYDPIAIFDDKDVAQPNLAESITPNADATVWTVVLPTGVTFHSGATLTAQSIVDDYTNYYTAKGAPTAGTFAEVTSVEATDPQTVVFTLKEPDTQFPVLLTTLYAFNPDVRDKYGEDFGAHPDGTGAFMLDQWDKNSQIVLKANPNYWRKDDQGQALPYLDEIVFKIITNGSTRLSTLESSGVDAMISQEASVLARVEKQTVLISCSRPAAAASGSS